MFRLCQGARYLPSPPDCPTSVGRTFRFAAMSHSAPTSSRENSNPPSASASWYTDLKISLKKNEKSRESRYFQLATVDSSGKPCNRTVVYRGFFPQGGAVNDSIITFVTDRRSDKVEQVAHCPFVEIAWYFPATREQYRLKGVIQVVGEESDPDLVKAREISWKNMSDPGRQQFLWPTPGVPRTGQDESQYDTKDHPQKDAPVAPHFCLCCVYVTHVDHLNLKTNERRVHARADGLANPTDIIESRHGTAVAWKPALRVNP
ncbi:Pyridoxine/pyridoxamine 5'-phosphate oxidase 2 [Picochlorum sp. SENEW3]|nr:Pyridoxine/pyridoxamine 5'-phosphate oxidase 2 [Picochlorum sp. SENEW3]